MLKDAEMQNHSRRFANNELVNIIFVTIIIMLIPISVDMVFIGDVLNPQLLACMYLVSMSFIFRYFYMAKIKVKRNSIIISLFCGLVYLLPLISNTIIGIESSNRDIINVLIIPMNCLVYLGFMENAEISKSDFNRLVGAIVYFSFAACIYNIFVNFDSILRVISITSSYQVNYRSIFANRNQFGGFLFLSIVAHSFYLADNKLRTLNLVVLVLQIANLILTMSRAAILATMVFCFVWVILSIKRIRTSWIMGSIIAIITTCLVKSKYWDFVLNILMRVDVGSSGRVEIWHQGFKVISLNPLNGIGQNSSLLYTSNQGIVFSQYHNMFLETLVSSGILGLLVLLYILFYPFFRCIKSGIHYSYKRIYTSSFIALLVLGTFESVSFLSIGYVDTIFTIFFISIPLLLANLREDVYIVNQRILVTIRDKDKDLI